MTFGSDGRLVVEGLANLRRILWISAPLMVSYGSVILYEFIHLVYLSHYSTEALAAVFPAFVVYWNIAALFIATVGYLRVFMGNEIGAGQDERVGQWHWIGMAVAVVANAAFIGLYFLSEPIFALIGHSAPLQRLEVQYFDMMVFAVFFQIAKTNFEAYYIAIGRVMVILVVNTIAVAVNIISSGLLIFGMAGFPEMGIKGAALATVIASAVALTCHLAHTVRDPDSRCYRVLRAPLFARDHTRRLLRIGVPNAVESILEESIWTVLILMIGKLGVTVLALTNVAVSILEFVFLPMVAVGQVVSVEVSKRTASGKTDERTTVVWPVLWATLGYTIICALLLIALSGPLSALFFADLEITDRATTLQWYFSVLVLCICSGCFYYINNSFLAGLGDTVFPMCMMAAGFVLVFLIPTYVLVIEGGAGFLWAWILFAANLLILASINGLRYFRSGAVTRTSKPGR